MKHLLLFAALLLATRAFADTPAKIAEDYHKAAAAALVKVNTMLEKCHHAAHRQAGHQR